VIPWSPNRALEREIREQALFWLVQSDADEAYETIDALFSKR
jgi:hypothetical protein